MSSAHSLVLPVLPVLFLFAVLSSPALCAPTMPSTHTRTSTSASTGLPPAHTLYTLSSDGTTLTGPSPASIVYDLAPALSVPGVTHHLSPSVSIHIDSSSAGPSPSGGTIIAHATSSLKILLGADTGNILSIHLIPENTILSPVSLSAHPGLYYSDDHTDEEAAPTLSHQSLYPPSNVTGVSRQDMPDRTYSCSDSRATPLELRVAVAFDATYCTQMGGKADAIASINTLLTGSEGIFSKSLCLRLSLVHVDGHCNSASDPYANLAGRGTDVMLDGFVKMWQDPTYQAVDRDVAFYLTAREGSSTAGRAYIGAVCSKSYGFGVCEGDSLGVFTHEVGHTLGANHVSNGIMKSFLSSGTPMEFSSESVKQITKYVDGEAACLEPMDGKKNVPDPTPSSSLSPLPMPSESASMSAMPMPSESASASPSKSESMTPMPSESESAVPSMSESMMPMASESSSAVPSMSESMMPMPSKTAFPSMPATMTPFPSMPASPSASMDMDMGMSSMSPSASFTPLGAPPSPSMSPIPASESPMESPSRDEMTREQRRRERRRAKRPASASPSPSMTMYYDPDQTPMPMMSDQPMMSPEPTGNNPDMEKDMDDDKDMDMDKGMDKDMKKPTKAGLSPFVVDSSAPPGSCAASFTGMSAFACTRFSDLGTISTVSGSVRVRARQMKGMFEVRLNTEVPGTVILMSVLRLGTVNDNSRSDNSGMSSVTLTVDPKHVSGNCCGTHVDMSLVLVVARGGDRMVYSSGIGRFELLVRCADACGKDLKKTDENGIVADAYMGSVMMTANMCPVCVM